MGHSGLRMGAPQSPSMSSRPWGHPAGGGSTSCSSLGSDLGQGGVGIGVLLLDRGPEAISTWGGEGPRQEVGEGHSPHAWEAFGVRVTWGTHWGAAARLCGAEAAPARPPREQGGPGPGPGQQPAGGLRGGRACWGGVHWSKGSSPRGPPGGQRAPPTPLPTPLFLALLGGGQAPPLPLGGSAGGVKGS